jgi:hypothetical protein
MKHRNYYLTLFLEALEQCALVEIIFLMLIGSVYLITLLFWGRC